MARPAYETGYRPWSPRRTRHGSGGSSRNPAQPHASRWPKARTCWCTASRTSPSTTPSSHAAMKEKGTVYVDLIVNSGYGGVNAGESVINPLERIAGQRVVKSFEAARTPAPGGCREIGRLSGGQDPGHGGQSGTGLRRRHTGRDGDGRRQYRHAPRRFRRGGDGRDGRRGPAGPRRPCQRHDRAGAHGRPREGSRQYRHRQGGRPQSAARRSAPGRACRRHGRRGDPRRRTGRGRGPADTPEAVVQRQLEAYNRGDIDAFAATYAEDVELFDLGADPKASSAAVVQRSSRPMARCLHD